jgi:hypothetical protein
VEVGGGCRRQSLRRAFRHVRDRFISIQEYSPVELQFTERFQWREGQFEVSLELSADEAVLEYRIGFVAACVCRDILSK